MTKSEKEYEDIINLPHHISENRSRMSNYDRAAQFSPFAALTGHSDALQETARLTQAKAEIDNDEKLLINEKLLMAMNIPETAVTVTYFEPDSRKKGGAYFEKSGFVKKIDTFKRNVIMADGSVIPVDNIISVDFNITE